MINIETVWGKITNYAGGNATFYTITGEPFTYTIEGSVLRVNRANRAISKSNFEKVLSLLPLTGPGQINRIAQGPAYVYAILMDIRIRGQDW